MNKPFIYLVLTIYLSAITLSLHSQKKSSPVNCITASDMESHVTFLASPLLKGRMNGEEGLEIAGQYLASQAKLAGLKPANGNSYFQPFTVIRKTIDTDKTNIKVISNAKDTITIKDPLFQMVPIGPADFTVEGEVIFAGYGIRSDKYKYNDFENIKTEGKIILLMGRAPMSEDGKKSLFEEPGWVSEMGFRLKLSSLIFTKAKAILIVPDPKSGFRSFAESSPELAGYLQSIASLKGKEKNPDPIMGIIPKVIFIDRSVADELLAGSGHTLDELQRTIDGSIQSYSFNIDGQHIMITEASLSEDKTLHNIAGYIEGRDPLLKKEIIIFSGHYDHIGTIGDKVNTGADDDASGCAALLSMAKAFNSLQKKPLRSILFLWVAGEEIGLYGSKSYVENPLFPIEKTVADLNMDMIGRVKEPADSTDETPMTGPERIFVITDDQSKDLRSIADDIDRKSPIDFDYSLSGQDHPLQLFARSDHYNFVEKNIPILFFTSGIHSDYHTPGDVVEKIDFNKMELVTRTMYKIGLTIANRKTRLVIDNPYSSWEKNK